MELEGKLDVIRVDLQPSEQYKSVSNGLVAMMTCYELTLHLTVDGASWT